MARTIGEVRNFLDGLVSQITVDKSDASLNGQCVSLIKNLLEFLGAPNPYGARGNASDIPNTYVSQEIARSGSGTLTIGVNRYEAGGLGHVWVKIGSDSWQANYAGLAVKKNVREVAITDLLNLDQWITGSNNSNSGSGGKATTLGSKGEALIKEYEGCRLTAYDLGDGMITIGWGHAEPKGQTSLVAGVTTWSQAQADSQFWKDIPPYVNAVNSYFTRSFTQNQFDAMVSFTYNVGTGAFANDNWDRNASNSYITESIANYINRGSAFEAGLRRRRQAEIDLFNTPVSAGETTKKEEFLMWVFYQANANAPVRWFNGEHAYALAHPDEIEAIKHIYKANTGRDVPWLKNWNDKSPYYNRLAAVLNRKADY